MHSEIGRLELCLYLCICVRVYVYVLLLLTHDLTSLISKLTETQSISFSNNKHILRGFLCGNNTYTYSLSTSPVLFSLGTGNDAHIQSEREVEELIPDDRSIRIIVSVCVCVYWNSVWRIYTMTNSIFIQIITDTIANRNKF